MDQSLLVNTVCPFCKIRFSKVSNKNRHVRNVHQQEVHANKEIRIICPLCKGNNVQLGTYINLKNHLSAVHEVSFTDVTFNFSSHEQYENWIVSEEIEINYAVTRHSKKQNCTEIHYGCNRSDTKGYQSNYKKRTEKSGGSIKIKGFCPSRIIVKKFENGVREVNFQKTHAGHDEELRSQHLSKSEKEAIVEKLKSGVTPDRILQDSRKVDSNKLTRENLLTRKDLQYLSTKYNIQKKRHTDQMVATALKIEEWNADGKNYAFIFKKEGQNHQVLRKEDFALGFMNKTMEDKFKKFHHIVCMDGTHGTNKKGLDLTTVLIKDDKNAGFPVAFFLSNRMDQLVQEVFLAALREKMREEIHPIYFMSDDDPKYFNAWVKVMGNQPRRLLCSWHVIKNWNLQGKAKIKDQDLKKRMKTEMKKILNETDEDNFRNLANNYLKKLEEANEVEFLNYLKRYYFQTNRIPMWAHCYRRNAGINTNMAIESLNNFLKNNQLKRKANVTVEKLLDAIDGLVDAKMWHRIINIERPNANSYQDRIIIKAHKKAEAMRDAGVEVIEKEFGQFQVKTSNGEKLYSIAYNLLCENECKTLFCRVCKICIHRYSCSCPEYEVKNTLCKHVHLVRMFEEGRGTNSVLDTITTVLSIESESEIKRLHQTEIDQFIEEKRHDVEETCINQEVARKNEIEDTCINQEVARKNEIEDLANFLSSLNQENYNTIMAKINVHRREIEGKCNQGKRKMDKQEYFPSKKRFR